MLPLHPQSSLCHFPASPFLHLPLLLSLNSLRASRTPHAALLPPCCLLLYWWRWLVWWGCFLQWSSPFWAASLSSPERFLPSILIHGLLCICFFPLDLEVVNLPAQAVRVVFNCRVIWTKNCLNSTRPCKEDAGVLCAFACLVCTLITDPRYITIMKWSEVALQLCPRYRRYYSLPESVGDKGTVCIDKKLSKINGWLFEKDTCSQRNMHQAIMAPQTWSEDRILKCHFLPKVTWQKVPGNKDGASARCA